LAKTVALGGNMISKDCKIESFLEAIEGKPTTEAIFLANQEATEAERLLLRSQTKVGTTTEPCSNDYVDNLKNFIGYVRYAVIKNRASKDKHHRMFKSYLESL
jgi:hypothetical protein